MMCWTLAAEIRVRCSTVSFLAQSESSGKVDQMVKVFVLQSFIYLIGVFWFSLQSGPHLFWQSGRRGCGDGAAQSDHPCQQLHSAQLQEEENVL